MKKFFSILMITFAMTAMVACNKDNNNNNDNSDDVSDGWVDLGLPSGVLWATCNVGATTPEESGDYFAWGETQTKDMYDWSTYAYGNAYNELTKYCCLADLGHDGFTDDLAGLEADDDAATVNMGGGARTPDTGNWNELLEYTTRTWTSVNGVNGCLFTAANGNTLFLPAAGNISGGELCDTTMGFYWSNTVYSVYPANAWCMFLSSGEVAVINGRGRTRSYGFTVRAVKSPVK